MTVLYVTTSGVRLATLFVVISRSILRGVGEKRARPEPLFSLFPKQDTVRCILQQRTRKGSNTRGTSVRPSPVKLHSWRVDLNPGEHAGKNKPSKKAAHGTYDMVADIVRPRS